MSSSLSHLASPGTQLAEFGVQTKTRKQSFFFFFLCVKLIGPYGNWTHALGLINTVAY